MDASPVATVELCSLHGGIGIKLFWSLVKEDQKGEVSGPHEDVPAWLKVGPRLPS